MSKKIIHLCREYRNQKAVAECGKDGLPDKEITFRACDVTCPKCQGTKAFQKAAKHPFFGVKSQDEKLADWEEDLFK